jgi:hypothetical protein
MNKIIELYEKISREGCKICGDKFWIQYFDGHNLIKEECYCREVEQEYWILMGEKNE